MKSKSLIPSRTALTIFSGIALTAGMAFHAKADAWDRKTVLTVSQTIQIRETVLEPGQYVLKLYDSNSDRHVVQIFNADQSHIIDTVMAIPTQRMEPTGHSQFTFWETPAGNARAMRAWYYPGDTIGQEFPYPKHLTPIAMASVSRTVVTQTVSPEPVTPVPASQPEETAQPEANNRETEQRPVEIAENSPPPQPETPPEAPQPTPAPQPATELPKTGSPYPLVGLLGGLLLGIYGVLRLKLWA